MRLGIAFNDSEVVLILFGSGISEIATLELSFVETIEEGKWDIFILFVLKLPVYPLLVLDLKIFKYAEINVHKNLLC